MSLEAELYVSTDVETDGPIPGPHSMLSLASAAYGLSGGGKILVSTFEANLEPLPGASGHPDTLAWWAGQPEAWAECHRDPRPPLKAMADYEAWLAGLPGRPVFVAWPLGFDFTFVYWYCHRFLGHSPFGHNGVDMRSYAMALLGQGYGDCGKGRLPPAWLDDLPHTHRALDDAIEQGALFCNMVLANPGRGPSA